MKELSRMTAATIDVLRILLDEPEPVWGLRIIKATSRPPGSVYPILDRLERAGWTTAYWEVGDARPGPRRRLYELTTGGTDAAASACAAFDARTTAPARDGTAGGASATARRAMPVTPTTATVRRTTPCTASAATASASASASASA